MVLSFYYSEDTYLAQSRGNGVSVLQILSSECVGT